LWASHVKEASIGEGVEYWSLWMTYIVGPLQDLWPDVVKEGLGYPAAAEDHNAVTGMIFEEKCHHSAQLDGFGSNFVRIKSKCAILEK
jgi:hypothetical protein